MSKAITLVQKFYPNVSKVKDATKPLDVVVDKSDINNSKIKNHRECVFAHACKRIENIDGAIIAIKSAYIIKGDIAIRYTIPDFLAREIIAFDREGKFEPGDYSLNEPAPSYRLNKPKPPRKQRKDLRKGSRHTGKSNWHATKSIRNLKNPE